MSSHERAVMKCIKVKNCNRGHIVSDSLYTLARGKKVLLTWFSNLEMLPQLRPNDSSRKQPNKRGNDNCRLKEKVESRMAPRLGVVGRSRMPSSIRAGDGEFQCLAIL